VPADVPKDILYYNAHTNGNLAELLDGAVYIFGATLNIPQEAEDVKRNFTI